MRHIEPDLQYIIRIRRELHQHPEIGFDLPVTLSIVKRELDALGIPYTDRYGKSSLVATLARGRGKVVALRADMDALPITEELDLPFKSQNEGQMHACGHDTHVAMLLGTAKMLKEVEDELPCEVRLFFQAAEEYAPGGAKLMCEDGCMDEVDCIIGAHIAPSRPIGTIGLNYGCIYASSHGFYIDFYGKSCHVATPHQGVDAIAMGCRAFMDMQMMRARECNPKDPIVLGIGEFHGGSANNIVCDHVRLHGTIRTISNRAHDHIWGRVNEIATRTAEDMGGHAEVITSKHYPAVVNNPELAKMIADIGREVLGEDCVDDKMPNCMGGEDFAFYLLHKPGVFFDIGAKTDKHPTAPAHNGRFYVDEDSLTTGPRIMFEFVSRYK